VSDDGNTFDGLQPEGSVEPLAFVDATTLSIDVAHDEAALTDASPLVPPFVEDASRVQHSDQVDIDEAPPLPLQSDAPSTDVEASFVADVEGDPSWPQVTTEYGVTSAASIATFYSELTGTTFMEAEAVAVATSLGFVSPAEGLTAEETAAIFTDVGLEAHAEPGSVVGVRRHLDDGRHVYLSIDGHLAAVTDVNFGEGTITLVDPELGRIDVPLSEWLAITDEPYDIAVVAPAQPDETPEHGHKPELKSQTGSVARSLVAGAALLPVGLSGVGLVALVRRRRR
jgi:hypothetical protein